MNQQSARLGHKFFFTLVVLGSAVIAGTTGCKKDEPPPPLPPPPATTAAPPPPLELAPEPEAVPDAAAPTEVKKGTGQAGPSLKKCCAALRQNAANAPPPNNDYMLQAAAACDALVAQGQQKQSIVTAVQVALKGVGMPVACQ
ncbi:MAG: acyltransferase [Polyangiaceae bacterium]|nr:acyltransferase [Polyangiaceae bacterium]